MSRPPLSNWPLRPDSAGGPSLESYARFVQSYRIFLLIGLLVGLAIGLGAHLSQPLRYTSTTHMVIVATTVSGSEDSASEVSIDSALQLLRSDRVVGRVAQETEYPGGAAALNDDLTTRPITNSRIVRLSVTALDPDVAQETVAATSKRFFEVRAQGLVRTAQARADAASAELDVVEAELGRRYALDVSEELTPEELEEEARLAPAGIADLVTLRAQLYGELATFSISEPNPGYLSRPATRAPQGARSGFAVTVTSAATLGLLGAVGIAALHQSAKRRIDVANPRSSARRSTPC